MPAVSQILHQRHKRTRRYQRAPGSRAGMAGAALFTLVLAIALLSLPVFYASVLSDLPSLASIPLLLDPDSGLYWQPTRFYDRSGEQVLLTVQNPAVTDRQYVRLPVSGQSGLRADQIAPEVITATLAIVDPDYFEHSGFSLNGFSQDRPTTLAQRLVADLLLRDEQPGWRHAIRERILAAQLVAEFGHDQVLEWYLNSLYYGNLAYGIDAAAQVYFGKPTSQLDLAEAALLTAVAEIPTINPHNDPQNSRARQVVVIEAMLSQGLIDAGQAEAALREEPIFRSPVNQQDELAGYFTNLVWEQLAAEFDLEILERGGFAIITTLDYDLQQQASCAAQVQIERLTGRSGLHPADTGTDCQAAALLPSLSLPQAAPADLGTSVVVLDPLTGQLLALVGDPEQGLDPAHLPGRAPGSSLTPFVYLTAFTRGFSPASLVWDIPPETVNLPFAVQPSEQGFNGPLRLRDALANDYLSPALQLMNQIGPENVWRTIQQVGLTHLDPAQAGSARNICRGCALLLDDGQVTLLNLAHAYSIFSNQGYLIGLPKGGLNGATSLAGASILEPVTILEVRDSSNQILFDQQAVEIRPIITNQLAYLVTHMLSDEGARWPSLGHPNPLEIGRPAAAKLGQTSSAQDAWTLGYTPQLVVGVWAGSSGQGEVSPRIAAGLWRAIIQYGTRALPPLEWPQPPGISQVDVCDPSGLLPTRYCPTVVSEIFLNGNEPTQPDNLYQAFAINRETGRLATVFTPPELIDERIYRLIPAFAMDWAEQAGVEMPPESYDVIAAPATLASAQITSPAMFANVRGTVIITGTASGDDFLSYRLQAGQGLNPQTWLQINQDEKQPVEAGPLANWDTRGLNGLYAIQLIVVRSNQRADTSTIQVTIDNQAPQVSIPYPQAGQIFNRSTSATITFQAQASDNIGLAAVEFYLDGELLIRQTQPPYAFPWPAQAGNHNLQVKGIDFAGNEQATTIQFTVR
ncbi:MAG: transglycosylase domain-containing protein [Anaerolineales bacterium]|nr:transglycosylase domain-containing protein [Anaerolineales bacterium]